MRRWRSPSRRSPELPSRPSRRRRTSRTARPRARPTRRSRPGISTSRRIPTPMRCSRWAGATAGPAAARRSSAAAPRTPLGRNLSAVIYDYWDALVAATANNPRVRVIKKYRRQDRQRSARDLLLRAGTPEQHRQPRRGPTATPPSGAACARARSRRRSASRPPATGPRSPGSPPPRTATSPPRARRSSASSTSWPRAWTATTLLRLKDLTLFLSPSATRTAATRSSATRPGALTPTATSARRTSRRTAASSRS